MGNLEASRGDRQAVDALWGQHPNIVADRLGHARDCGADDARLQELEVDERMQTSGLVRQALHGVDQ
ncbi:MAG: hypothetical protein WC604_05240 [Candidatus Gracilibacteria bacterium]